jgi:hypothetical protein
VFSLPFLGLLFFSESQSARGEKKSKMVEYAFVVTAFFSHYFAYEYPLRHTWIKQTNFNVENAKNKWKEILLLRPMNFFCSIQ